MKAWVEETARELMLKNRRRGTIKTTTPEDPEVIRVYASLPGESKRLDGPEIPHEWIIFEDLRRNAEAALKTFVLRLPEKAE